MQPTRPTLYVLIGNIGSGKSTWVKDNKDRLKAIVVSRDSLRYMIGAGDYIFDRELEPYIFKTERDALHNFMRTNRNIIVDEVGVSRKLRELYLDIASIYSYKTVAVCLPRYSKEVCVDRRMKHQHRNQSKEIWNSVWESFNDRYEKPTKQEGFHQIMKVRTACPTLKLQKEKN